MAEDSAAVHPRSPRETRSHPDRPGFPVARTAAHASLLRLRHPVARHDLRALVARTAAHASFPRAAAFGGLLLGLLACAGPAKAQISPAPADFPVGELYRLELLGSLWPPAEDLTVVSRGSGASAAITGANETDAGAPRFTDLRIRLRLSRRQRVHLDHLPIRYPTATTLHRGPPAGRAGLEPGAPAASTLTWRTWRLAYEYDFIHLARGSLGLVAEAAYTDVRVALDGAPGPGCGAESAGCEIARFRQPIPAAGGVLRLYPSPVIMLGGEVRLLRMPDWIGDFLGYTGEHLVYDVHAALNFIEAFGLQIGYRSRSLRLRTAELDADLELEGVYVGALLRF